MVNKIFPVSMSVPTHTKQEESKCLTNTRFKPFVAR